MSFGPAGYEDDWDDDDFDFGEHCDTDHSSHNFYQTSSQNYFAEHVKNEASEMPSTFSNGKAKINSSLGSTTNHNTTPKISFGRGRGRGGFSSPKSQTKPGINTRKNKTVDKQNKGQGNFLFTRTSDKKRKNILDEKKDCQTAEDFRAAILKGDVAMVVNILNQGTAVDCILKTGWTGLMHAANCGLLEILTVLIEKGANVNFQKDMFSVLMAACSSDSDAEDDLVQCVNYLIEKGAKINCHDRYHMTPLMYACRNGSAKIVDVLLLHKPDVNKQDQRGWTALGWAASRGHGRVVRMLLDKNANPKQYTNDGQSAEDLAYDGGFTIIADILHTAANPTRHEQNAQNIQDSRLISEQGQGGCLRYGDLELFLFGLELGHLVPLFQAQEISFDGFLQLTDTDLQQIGVSQVGVRKKILAATHDVHTKQWDLSSLPSQQSTNQFTGEDMNLILANVEKHLLHIQCSIGYARNSLHGMEDPTVIIQDEEHAQKFLDQTTSVLRAASGIEDEVKSLQCSVKKIALTVPTTAADLIHSLQDESKERQFTYLPVLVVGGCLALGLTAVWLSHRSEL